MKKPNPRNPDTPQETVIINDHSSHPSIPPQWMDNGTNIDMAIRDHQMALKEKLNSTKYFILLYFLIGVGIGFTLGFMWLRHR